MHIVEITLENAKELLIEESFKRPVVVDFWADWCGPCKSLMPILEKLANEYAGAFLLAKVDAEEQHMISAQFGIQSLPTVMVIKDGQPVDGFMGALPEIQVREVLEKHVSKPETALQKAQALMAEEKYQEALPLLREAHEESEKLIPMMIRDTNQPSKEAASIACLMAKCHLELNRLDNAEAILSGIKMADRDALYEQLQAQIALKKQAAKTPELNALEIAFAANPQDMQIRYSLALQLSHESQHRDALTHLIEILRLDRQFAEGAARKSFNDIVAALGKADPLAIEFQRKLFTLLY
jgi:putative thioredoxin